MESKVEHCSYAEDILLAKTGKKLPYGQFDAATPAKWAEDFGNNQYSPSRREDAPGGPLKSAAVLEAARALQSIGIDQSTDITVENVDAVKAALTSVSGIGNATSRYFLMLTGIQGTKPDTMIHRFIADALGSPVDSDTAAQLLLETARHLGVHSIALDHAIWSYESSRS